MLLTFSDKPFSEYMKPSSKLLFTQATVVWLVVGRDQCVWVMSNVIVLHGVFLWPAAAVTLKLSRGSNICDRTQGYDIVTLFLQETAGADTQSS